MHSADHRVLGGNTFYSLGDSSNKHGIVRVRISASSLVIGSPYRHQAQDVILKFNEGYFLYHGRDNGSY